MTASPRRTAGVHELAYACRRRRAGNRVSNPAPPAMTQAAARYWWMSPQAVTSSPRAAPGTLNETLRGSICAWRAEVERAVWSVDVVMIDVDAQDALVVSMISNAQPVQALGTHGPHASLGDGVRPGLTKRSPHDLNALATEDLVEGMRERAVAVVDQIAGRRRALR